MITSQSGRQIEMERMAYRSTADHAAHYTAIRDLVDREIADALNGVAEGFDVDALVQRLRDADLIVWTAAGFSLVKDEIGETPGFWDFVAELDQAAQAAAYTVETQVRNDTGAWETVDIDTTMTCRLAEIAGSTLVREAATESGTAAGATVRIVALRDGVVIAESDEYEMAAE